MAVLEHPYTDISGGEWIAGNLHAHTTNSDGERSPQRVVDTYAGLGHGFLMISDHDTFTSEAELASVDNRGMILIPGNEITANGPHMLHIGAGSLVAPDADRQKIIDDVVSSGGIVIFNHPKWQSRFNHCPQELLESCNDYAGLEVYNGVISRLQGSPYATDRWDLLLNQGRRLWGFANDDSHKAVGDDGWGWNVVYARERSVSGVVDALTSGRFYPSTGVKIQDIAVDGLHISLTTANAGRIVALCDAGQRFAQVDAASIEVDVPQDASYVRFECWGEGESFAWTQPFFMVS
jgi:hypothetical protein